MASSLRSTLHRAVELALLGVAATAACNASDSQTEPSAGDAGADARGAGMNPAFLPEGEATFACDAPLPEVVSNLVPSRPWDYVELRSVELSNQDGGAPVVTTTSRKGTPCLTATNVTACTGALAATPNPSKGWVEGGDQMDTTPVRQQLVFTRGEEVGVALTTAEVAEQLAPIDTAEEARLLVATSGARFACTTKPAKSGIRRNADGSWDVLVAGASCGGSIPFRNLLHVTAEGAVSLVASDPVVEADPRVVCGRRPSGLVEPEEGPGSALAAYFARCAHLEAASVVSFRRLEAELRALGAPERLLAGARRSRHDEVAHAREMAAHALAHGATPPPVEVHDRGDRDAFEIALENAVEGCVFETYGAALAAYQAERAPAALRPLFARLAEDELRHAELAHDVAAWLEPRLTPVEQSRLSEARREALARLLEATKAPPDPALASAVGLPSARAAHVLAAGVARALREAA